MTFNECIKAVDVFTRRELRFGVASWREEVVPGETSVAAPAARVFLVQVSREHH